MNYRNIVFWKLGVKGVSTGGFLFLNYPIRLNRIFFLMSPMEELSVLTPIRVRGFLLHGFSMRCILGGQLGVMKIKLRDT
jgi:hypothetical protein